MYFCWSEVFAVGAAEDDLSGAWSDISDVSYQSDIDNEHFSVNFDLSNGAPFDTNNFSVLHYNINSITAESRLEELTSICNLLHLGVLICTESKLDNTIPNNIITLDGFHEPLRKDQNRSGGGTLIIHISKLSIQTKTRLRGEQF